MVPLGFLTCEILVALAEKSKLRQSCATQPTVYVSPGGASVGSVGVSLLPRTYPSAGKCVGDDEKMLRTELQKQAPVVIAVANSVST